MRKKKKAVNSKFFTEAMSRSVSGEAMRFVLGSLSTTVVCWGSLICLVEIFHVHYLVSANFSTFIAYHYSFFLNKYFVFKQVETKYIKQGIKFLMSQIFLLFLGNIMLYTGVDLLHLNYLLVTVVMAGFLACLNFTLMKISVFN